MLQKLFDKIKDYSILYSFDSSGFARHEKYFETIDDSYFKDKHYFITGGTSGIGEALALRLVDAGAKVSVTGRNKEKFDSSPLAQHRVEFIELDMADFEGLKSIELPKIDGLVCNAGGMPDTLKVIDGKYDLIFASQVVGHYILINRFIKERLLPEKAPVHITSSGGMYLAKLKLDDLTWQDREYDKVASYANAKRAQVILNQELAKKFRNIHFSSSHPGWVGTAALEEALPDFVNKVKDRLRSSNQGADTIYWCLYKNVKINSGAFWFDRKARRIYPFFWTRESPSQRKKLVDICHRASDN